MQQSEPKLRSNVQGLSVVPPRAPEELDEAGRVSVEGHASFWRESTEVYRYIQTQASKHCWRRHLAQFKQKPLPIGSKWDAQMSRLYIYKYQSFRVYQVSVYRVEGHRSRVKGVLPFPTTPDGLVALRRKRRLTRRMGS